MSLETEQLNLDPRLVERLTTTTFLVPIDRSNLFRFLDPHGVGAEVGVATGGFARAIFDGCTPAKMHLIDLWESQSLEEYPEDGFNQNAEFHNRNYDNTVRLFSPELKKEKVIIHRGQSVERAKDFKDEYFDWVHIDANHTYNGAYADLVAYAPKVKSDGLIFCHDYTNNEVLKKMSFGVVEAVKDFCTKFGYFPIALATVDPFPTIVLTKSPNSSVSVGFLASLLFRVNGIVEIRDFLNRKYEHLEFPFSPKKSSFLISI